MDTQPQYARTLYGIEARITGDPATQIGKVCNGSNDQAGVKTTIVDASIANAYKDAPRTHLCKNTSPHLSLDSLESIK